MASGSVWVMPGQAPGEERGRAELPERPRPREGRSRGEAPAGERRLDAEERARGTGAERARRPDELPVHGGEPRGRLPDVEGHGDERLRHHHGDPGEGDVDVERVELVAEQAQPAERGEERDAGHDRGDHQRQLEEGRQDVPPREPLRGDQVGHRRPDDDDEGERDEARLQAHPQRVEGDLRSAAGCTSVESGTRRKIESSGSPMKKMRTAAAIAVIAAAAPR